MYQQTSLDDLITGPTPPGFWDDAEIISRYTRAQAIEDGVLSDVSKIAREAGIIHPVALTTNIRIDLDDIPPTRSGIESYQGRMWDLLNIARWYMRSAPDGKDTIYAKMILTRLEQHVSGRNVFKKTYIFKIHVGPGDTPAPVITIMRKDED
ncbi:MAG: hypothetical protein AVDCRST_MAG93-4643 [uncultured Chloroflexia bacterium]|uniref:Uncharacterized protein n=1 Tax=uncultured Chloroflexia bacterium TaxID=1672391 RepID=A0A6J4KD56_9CHLR|nr:MAG: hypothetical protein AVDCRST_MAG93-4643 [uncultured Chloroflexia bacterium]